MRRQDDEILQNKNTHQLNIRLNHENFALLNQISKDAKQSPSTVGSQIISQWIEFYYYKIHRGDVIFSRQVLKKIISNLDKSEIDKISEFMAKHIIKEIRLQEVDVTYPILSDRILKWNKGNSLQLNRFKQNIGHNDDCLDVFISKPLMSDSFNPSLESYFPRTWGRSPASATNDIITLLPGRCRIQHISNL